MKNNNNHIVLLLTVLAIILFGTFLMYSASSSFAYYKFNKSDTFFLSKQLFWLLIGFGLIIFIQKVNPQILNKFSKHILFFSWIIMLIPIITNLGTDTVDRWLKYGGQTILTTSDLGKLGIIIFTSSFIDKFYNNVNDSKILLYEYLPYAFISLSIIAYQPDLSTTLVLASILFSLLFIAGLNKINIIRLFGLGVIALVTLILRFPYQLKRIKFWIGLEESHQSSNSILALANGGFTGNGLGDSTFKYNGFIPEGQTDFVLAIIGEELGFIGIFFIFIIFTFLFLQGLKISKQSTNRFYMFLSMGLTINLFFYLLINSAYVVQILPTTGLPIPFISYGGSQTIFSMISIGLLMSIARENQINLNPKFYYGRN